MTNKEILKKKIIYRSTHRGSKEMDILLGNFLEKHIDNFKNQVGCLKTNISTLDSGIEPIYHEWSDLNTLPEDCGGHTRFYSQLLDFVPRRLECNAQSKVIALRQGQRGHAGWERDT